MMATGYLWTGQFPELTKVITEGQSHSMELDGETLDGHWATDNNLGVDFFIINDATFSKLCILGDDVEPCYEGSSITSPQVSSNFTKDKTFEQTLFTMMQELKDTLNSKGGLNMSETQNKDFEELENSNEDTSEIEEDFSENNENTDIIEDTNTDEEDINTIEDNEIESEEDDAKDDSETDENNQEENSDEQFTAKQFEQMSLELESLRAEVAELREFKSNIEMQKKQQLVNRYFMISDEDKAEIVNNLSNYSYDEIEAKLAILYVEQNVDFSEVDGQSNDNPSPTLSFSLEEETNREELTDLQRALRETRI